MIPRVILVDLIEPKTPEKKAAQSMAELENLVETFGAFVVVKKIQKKQSPDYKTYIGSGKLEEVRAVALEEKVDFIIFNNILKPQQLFNVEKYLWKDNIKVWDRIDLILKIFDKHATTSEAKLQIELAALRHMGPRIFGMGLELSKQGAGVGTRGKGETNIEIMKRHIAEQERKIREKLKKVEDMRERQRKARERKNLKTVAIVGYTNAGKSHLLTSLTQKNVKVQNELFATLDTRIGQLYLPKSYASCLVSDTIGFIQKLPPSLIDAFKSTLDEAVHADLLLHVIDFSDPEKDMKMKVVHEILYDLGVRDTPMLYVCNKIDQIKQLRTKSFEKKFQKYSPVFVSARTKQNLDVLVQSIEEILFKDLDEVS